MFTAEITGKAYFISDCHFGLPNQEESSEREKRVVAFLKSIENEVTHLFLLGDIFDFWFEYKYVVPKYNIRFLGKLAELSDNGVQIYYILGNHDMWNFGYLKKELKLTQLTGIHDFMINGKKVRLGHGDGLDPNDKGYLLIKWIYGRKINQRLLASLPTRWAFAIAQTVSLKSRNAHLDEDKIFQGEEKEPIIAYCKKILQKEHFDFFLFGHRHYPIDFELNNNSHYINVGDWQFHDSFAVMQNGECELKIMCGK
jgi:UDP-2,3-diacylglucosamine hydrolase